jgi:hypothetical protein
MRRVIMTVLGGVALLASVAATAATIRPAGAVQEPTVTVYKGPT